MSLFGKIRDYSFFFIGLILFSFVFNPKTLLNFFSFHAIFKIDEKKIKNFLKLKKKLYPTSSYILHKIKEEKHLIQSAKKIGIQFMDKDFCNFWAKKSIYKHITQFKKKEGTKKFKYYLLNIRNIKNHGFVWFQQKKNINDKILMNQYLDMCLCGLNTKKSFLSKKVTVDYLFFPYKEYEKKQKFKIRDDEIADYMKANYFFSNLGDMEFFFLNFSRKFSKIDSEIIKKQMESLFFEFKKETKYLINYHSDVSYNPIYYSYNFLPSFLRNLLILKKSKRVSFLKRKNYYLLAKITGKKMISNSIRASHIFIYHKGSFSNTIFSSKKRISIEESIKKINELKKPKLFKALVKKESYNGYLGLGWIDIGGIKKTSDFQNFLIENPKGKIGVFETPIGYHIIRIDDKSPLRPFYQLSIFLKYINYSKKTEETLNQRVKEFIQENGKANFSFFAKNARKKGSQVRTKIDYTILDFYSEIIQWSFDKKRKLGEFKVFFYFKQSYIIARISDISRVSVKNEVKKILKKKKISKELAKNFLYHKYQKIKKMENPIGRESKVVGVSLGLPINNIYFTINGENGVFLILVS
ncbi:MAG TPA: peptidylprolyl isomerase [Candidatus Angelobacter sp.]|jgi:peptidyl-prolyl cis-trans isomerase D|nr:peptidylprolyl isomerase [Candidatus Angelobacter sp.]